MGGHADFLVESVGLVHAPSSAWISRPAARQHAATHLGTIGKGSTIACIISVKAPDGFHVGSKSWREWPSCYAPSQSIRADAPFELLETKSSEKLIYNLSKCLLCCSPTAFDAAFSASATAVKRPNMSSADKSDVALSCAVGTI